MSDLLILGRGPSAHDMTWPDMPVMAVSSGIFMVPEGRVPDHFATLDTLKFFMAGLWGNGVDGWFEDDGARHWPFWAEPSIVKHVVANRARPGVYRTLPPEVAKLIPEHHQAPFQTAMIESMHQFGFQPGWGDHANVRGWHIAHEGPPRFTGEGWMGCDELNNSLLFAVQVAHQLGYKRLHFLGCDLDPDDSPHFERLLQIMRRWHLLALEQGFTWIDDSPTRVLGRIFGHAHAPPMGSPELLKSHRPVMS